MAWRSSSATLARSAKSSAIAALRSKSGLGGAGRSATLDGNSIGLWDVR